MEKQYGVMIQQYKHFTKDEYETLRYLSHIAKNLRNETLYVKRQHFFNTGEILSAKDTYYQLKNSENFKILSFNMAENILTDVEENFKT